MYRGFLFVQQIVKQGQALTDLDVAPKLVALKELLGAAGIGGDADGAASDAQDQGLFSLF